LPPICHKGTLLEISDLTISGGIELIFCTAVLNSLSDVQNSNNDQGLDKHRCLDL